MFQLFVLMRKQNTTRLYEEAEDSGIIALNGFLHACLLILANPISRHW
jgi:hypothetical protein